MGRFLKGLWATSIVLLSWAAVAADGAASVPAPASAPSATLAPAAAMSSMTAAPVTVPPMPNALSGGMGAQLLQLVLGLLLVVGLIFVLAWLMRRVQRAGPAGNQVIELIGSRALGPRDRLVLVQVGNEQVLLGVSPGSITALHVMNEPVQVPETQSATPEFARRLLEALGNKGALGGKGSTGSGGRGDAGSPGHKDNH